MEKKAEFLSRIALFVPELANDEILRLSSQALQAWLIGCRQDGTKVVKMARRFLKKPLCGVGYSSAHVAQRYRKKRLVKRLTSSNPIQIRLDNPSIIE